MSQLYILNETFTNGFSHNGLTILSVISVLCGISVIISKNPIVSVLFLIALFLSVSIYLMMLGMNFIGLSYLLVYVGAVSILFLFILMLINVRISELTSENYNSIPLAIATGVFSSFTVYRLLPINVSYNNEFNILDLLHNQQNSIGNYYNLSSYNDLYYVTSHIWDGALAESSHITSIGNVLYTGYPLLLILTSIILLLAMVGSIIITINQK